MMDPSLLLLMKQVKMTEPMYVILKELFEVNVHKSMRLSGVEPDTQFAQH